MYQDVIKLEKFYQSELGIFIKDRIFSKLKKYIHLYDGEKVGSFGFGEPYLNFTTKKRISIFNFFSKKIGVKKNILNEKIFNILLDEEQLPIEDSFFNHIICIHYLENAENLKKTIRELWRVLSPEGKIYIILPNKKSSWSFSSRSPFSSGFGFSKNQINQILEDNFFETQFIDRLIYFPSWNFSLLLKNKFFLEKIGSYFWRFFNGFYLCVATKRIYVNPSQKNFSFVKKIKKVEQV